MIFPEQWSPTACKRSHHLHRAGGRQWRDPPLHWEGAGDGDGGRACWHPGHQVRLLLILMVEIRGGDQVAVPHCVPFILIIHSQESHSPYLPFSASALWAFSSWSSSSFTGPFLSVLRTLKYSFCLLYVNTWIQKPHTCSCWWALLELKRFWCWIHSFLLNRINAIDKDGTFPNNQVYYYIVDSIRNEGKDSFEINSQSGEVFTKQIFDRETKGAFALEVEARDGAPSARPNSGGKPNTGKKRVRTTFLWKRIWILAFFIASFQFLNLLIVVKRVSI